MLGRKCFLLGIFLVLMLALTGCGEDSSSDDDNGGSNGNNQGSPSFANVVGTLNMPGTSAGSTYAVLLDNDLDGGNGMVNSTTGTVGAGTAQAYSLGIIRTGSYYLYALVYNSPGPANGPPEDGDYVGYFGGTLANPPAIPNATVSAGDVTRDLTLQVWNEAGVGTPGTSTVSGNLSLPVNVTSEPYFVAIDNDFDGGNGVLYSEEGTTPGAPTNTIPYSISGVASGTYYVYAVVWVTGDGNDGPTDGDYVGIDGGSLSGGLPGAPTVTITEPDPKTVNLTMEQCTGGACD
jgi:hypothetical protein